MAQGGSGSPRRVRARASKFLLKVKLDATQQAILNDPYLLVDIRSHMDQGQSFEYEYIYVCRTLLTILLLCTVSEAYKTSSLDE